MITNEELASVIENTKITLTDKERDALHQDLNSAMDIFAAIDDSLVEGIEPLFYPNMQLYMFRDESLTLHTDRAELLANTKETQDGYFKFPAVLKGEED